MVQKLPEYERQETIQTTDMPDVAGAFRQLGASSNSLSVIGATVAQSANTALAEKLGYEAGQNPSGDVTPPITEFDKHFANSYHNQAAAVLSMQGQKLLMDADLELGKANRLTPELIASTNKQVGIGLEAILKNAPNAIKGQLAQRFTSVALQQNQQYTLKMYRQNREDQANMLLASAREDQQTAYRLASSGNIDGAIQIAEQNKAKMKAGEQDTLVNALQTKTSYEATRLAALHGKYVYIAQVANQNGQLEKFYESLTKHPPADLKNSDDYQSTLQAVSSYMGSVKSLQNQYDNYRLTQFQTSLAQDPSGITGDMLAQLKSDVSPATYAKAELDYVKAMKVYNNQTSQSANVIAAWGDASTFARAQSDHINKAFDALTDNVMKQSNAQNIPMTKDDAEVMVAASAGGKVPVFVRSLENKLTSANPDMIESGSQQIHRLISMGAGHALIGLSDEAKAVQVKYESLRDSLDPTTAAKEATNAVLNQDPEMVQANKTKWTNYLSTNTKSQTPDDFALSVAGYSKKDFVTPYAAHVYGTDILNKFNTYYQLTNGDAEAAKKMVKQLVDSSYGYTYVNGSSYITEHPIEKVLGYKNHDVVPYIHEDLARQLNEKFAPVKEAYAKGQTDQYWEVLPVNKTNRGYIYNDYEPVQVRRHMKVNNKDVVDKFDVFLQGNPYDYWDVTVNSPTGMRSLFQVAPYLGVIGYVPDKKAIDEAYLNGNGITKKNTEPTTSTPDLTNNAPKETSEPMAERNPVEATAQEKPAEPVEPVKQTAPQGEPEKKEIKEPDLIEPNKPTYRDVPPVEDEERALSTDKQSMRENSVRGIRNNNPGNIKKTDDKWAGEVKGDDRIFKTFKSAADGITAMGKILKTYATKHGVDTVEKLIKRWSSTDQNEYIQFVLDKTGLSKTSKIDLTSKSIRATIIKAIIQFENGSNPYDDNLITRNA